MWRLGAAGSGRVAAGASLEPQSRSGVLNPQMFYVSKHSFINCQCFKNCEVSCTSKFQVQFLKSFLYQENLAMVASLFCMTGSDNGGGASPLRGAAFSGHSLAWHPSLLLPGHLCLQTLHRVLGGARRARKCPSDTLSFPKALKGLKGQTEAIPCVVGDEEVWTSNVQYQVSVSAVSGQGSGSP